MISNYEKKILKLIKYYLDRAIADRTQTTGVKVKINRTITPAKYEANTAYKTTLNKK